MNFEDYDLLCTLIKEVLFENLQEICIEDELDLQRDLYIDSIAFYTLIVKLEQAFHITFKIVSINASEFRTVGSLAAYIVSLKGEDKN